MSWNDFNTADEQREFDVIPKNTLVKVRMTIKPGGYDDPQQGWNGGYATYSEKTGAIYLECEFVVLDGPYARRKIWSQIGLHSERGPEWGNMGRAFVKGLLNSAHGLDPKDMSPQAIQARCIQGFHNLDGVSFVAKVSIEKDQYGEPRNVIKLAVAADHKDYDAVMNGAHVQPTSAPASHTSDMPMRPHSPPQTQQPPQQQTPHSATPTHAQPLPASSSSRPSWAK